MDNAIVYRPTLEEQRFFDEVRQHIDRNRDDFREAGRWLETEYAIEQVDQREREGRPDDPANYQQARKEMEQLDRAAGLRPTERSPASVLYVRLIRCAKDILRDQPDVTNYERNERLPLARRIIFVTWLMTDPDAADLQLSFTTLETMPWCRGWDVSLGRSMLRDAVLARGWMKLARPAWLVLHHIDGAMEPVGGSTPSTATLGDGGESFAGEPVVEAVDRTKLGHAEKFQVVADDDGTRRSSPLSSLEQFALALSMEVRAFKKKALADWGLEQDGSKWTVDLSLVGVEYAKRINDHAHKLIKGRKSNKK